MSAIYTDIDINHSVSHYTNADTDKISGYFITLSKRGNIDSAMMLQWIECSTNSIHNHRHNSEYNSLTVSSRQ